MEITTTGIVPVIPSIIIIMVNNINLNDNSHLESKEVLQKVITKHKLCSSISEIQKCLNGTSKKLERREPSTCAQDKQAKDKL